MKQRKKKAGGPIPHAKSQGSPTHPNCGQRGGTGLHSKWFPRYLSDIPHPLRTGLVILSGGFTTRLMTDVFPGVMVVRTAGGRLLPGPLIPMRGQRYKNVPRRRLARRGLPEPLLQDSFKYGG